VADFATIEDVEAFLQVEISEPVQVASVERALAEATAAIRNYCNQYLELVEDEEITLDSAGGVRLFLPELPVIEVSEVVEDGETLTPDDDYKLGQWGILHRVNRRWVQGIQIVTITYSHGYETLPDDIIAIATRAAARGFQAGLRAADDEAVVGVQSKSLGDFAVAYGSEQGGGGGEGVMGASAARMLLMSEKDILDKYRIKGP
jgi:hypothetical protein